MRHLSEPLFEKDFLSQLPEEIACRIIAYLTPCDLMTCAGVSRAWRRLCEDDRTWRQECLERGYVKFDAPSFCFLGGWATNRANEQGGIAISSHMTFQEARQNRREREIAYGKCYERSSWKSLYLRKKRIISNWRSRAIQSSTVQKVYKGIFRLQVHSGRIITGSADNTLRVWNVDDTQPAFTLTGHMGRILTFQMSDDGKYIISGSADQTVRVWCGQTGFQRDVLQGHTGTVNCISLHGTTLVSGSGDQTLRVWDIIDGKCLHILTGHLAEVRFVLFDGKRVVSSADGDDFTVKVWNAHTEECLYMLKGHTDTILSLLFESERDLVVSGSRDGTIRVWDVRRGSSMDGLVMLWDVDKGIFVRDLVRLASCGYGGYNWLLKATETLLVGAFEARLAESTNLIFIDFDAAYP
ncbi:unnamed protein product, partial [Mesorhabditis belari]|uniref:F-box domain-containing protein n=1 Tax=Mesorhabditis belari TaxID=2138241 RepID=A0AAF3F186_9BILA